MPSQKRKAIGIGSPCEVELFIARNELFFDTFDSLKKALDLAFVREVTGYKAADPVIFYLCRRCMDDFWEIMVLCSNGYGPGASALLRGMFERAVTATYIHQHPETADDFVAYHAVQQHKIASEIKNTPGISPKHGAKMAELEPTLKEARSRFEVTDCKTGKARRNRTWSKLDFVTMAKSVGELGRLIVPAYYVPLEHAHATLASAIAGLQEVDGVITDKGERDYKQIDRTFQFAHLILLEALEIQFKRFGPEALGDAINASCEDYKRAWFKESSDAAG